ncbi:DMT family transporter [Sphingomonas colocasiae]|uniref:DMT family transporter n=1 Tax=Sphingomonas colocasiae TaxID=1848973 RepID=A0ABS7PP98_9SPHN|nr:DMT family transporter [Sphingomonas colocasiae]MBY8822540.1 DMT family transporter [Sphingomonas colocasiae]
MKPAGGAAAFAVAALGIAVFSAMDALMKGLSIEMGAYSAMLWRSIFGLIIGGVLFVAGRRRWPGRPVLVLHFWRGLTAGLSVLLFFWGLARMPIAQGVALSFIAPLIALYLAAVMLKERVDRTAIAASALAFLGVLVILIGQARADMGPEAFRGAIAVLIGAVLYAFSLIVARRQSQVADPFEVALFFNIVALGIYMPAAPWWAVAPDATQVPRLMVCAIFAFVSIMLLSWAYARAEASYLLPVEYTAFIWASLLGWWVFGESVSMMTIAGALLIVAGCLWAARRKPGVPPATEAAL